MISAFWLGLPVVAGAQSANSPTSSYDRQLQVTPDQMVSRSTKTSAEQPPNSFIQYGDIWGCNDGYDKKKNTCISIFSKLGGQPENSYVQYGTIWGCKRGFSREGDKCVSIFTKKRPVIRAKNGKPSESSSRKARSGS